MGRMVRQCDSNRYAKPCQNSAWFFGVLIDVRSDSQIQIKRTKAAFRQFSEVKLPRRDSRSRPEAALSRADPDVVNVGTGCRDSGILDQRFNLT